MRRLLVYGYSHVELVSTSQLLGRMLIWSLIGPVGCWNKFSM